MVWCKGWTGCTARFDKQIERPSDYGEERSRTVKYDEHIIHRLRRAEGQIRGIIRMMSEEKNCRDVITQLSAVRSSIDRTIALIVAENLISCIENQEFSGATREDNIRQAIDLLLKSR